VSVKEAREYYKYVLNIICVTQTVTSSVTVLEAAIFGKISVKNLNRNQKKWEKMWHGEIFYINFNPKGGLAVDFMEC